MRSLLIASTLLVSGSLVAAPAASGYVIEGERHPGGRTITFYNDAPQHEAAVAQAVDAWNTSGARVEFLPAPREEAELVITTGPPELGGSTSLFDTGHPEPGAAEVQLPGITGEAARSQRFVVALIAAHELGHVLGLGHEDSVCATMNSSITEDTPSRCPSPQPKPWQSRCRLLEEDDVRGAVELYGGRPRLGRQRTYCDKFPPPPPPAAVTVSSDPAVSDKVTLRWRNASSDRLASVVVARRAGVCPTRPKGAGAQSLDAAAGKVDSLTFELSLERHCYSLWSGDEFGRVSPEPATVWIEPPPPPAAPRDLTVVSATSYPLDPRPTSLRWRNAGIRTLRGVVIARASGSCPTEPPRHPRPWVSPPALPGEVQQYQDFGFYPDDSGRFCYAVWSRDRFGRLGGAATVSPRRIEPAAEEVVLGE